MGMNTGNEKYQHMYPMYSTPLNYTTIIVSVAVVSHKLVNICALGTHIMVSDICDRAYEIQP